MIRNSPISAVFRTCVPPHSSIDTSGTSTTRTTSPYFSPNSAIAPRARASAYGISFHATGPRAPDLLVHDRLDLGELARPAPGRDA